MFPVVNNEELAETDAAHPFNQAVAFELRMQRTRKGRTNADIARETGIDSDQLGRYMKGFRPIRVAALAQISQALGTTPGEIMERAQTALDG